MIKFPQTETIDVVELGIDAVHGRGFELNKPGPAPFHTFAHYNSPIVLRDVNGVREWPAGISIVQSRNAPRYVRAESADLLNTWFHFEGPGARACLDAYEIPIDTVLDLGELPFLRPILEEIRQERSQKPLYWQDAVSDLVRQLFRELGALRVDCDNSLTPTQRKLERTLRDIRMRVHSDLTRRWTVPEMAAFGDMHPNWFSVVYAKQFGASPIDDLLNARIKHAEALLTHLPMTVSQIAAECGFANVEHFNRLFHKRLGCTPSQVRRQSSSRALRRA
jgi:AraC-like DNA-binding protein